MEKPDQLTTSSGAPVDDNQNSLSAGPDGPVLMQDFHLIDKLSHFDRERIPERVVHAKGSGAIGEFEVLEDVTKYTKAKFLRKGEKTKVLARFSTVGGEKGSADTERDPRGFALKFYTEEGNWDMVGNNTPVFFVRDPLKFPDFIHTQKRNPQTNCKDPDAFWDFLSLTPESVHQVTILFSDRGTPKGFRHMHGFSSHTFKWINAEGKTTFVKLNFRTDQKIENFTREEAGKMGVQDKDFATKDLFDAIEKKEFPSWTLYAQFMPEEDAEKYRFNILDVTKVWFHADYPLIKIGKLTLNANVKNFFAEIEQAAFSPGHLVPGIEPSLDKMLQARLFSYPDTHRHRLGANYQQIPVNCPYRVKIANYQRDGLSAVNGNGGSGPNYEPNTQNGPIQDKKFAVAPYKIEGTAIRAKTLHKNSDFEQPQALFKRVMKEQDRENLIGNIKTHLKNAQKEIQGRQLKVFYQVDPDYGMRVANGIGFPVTFATKF